MKKFLNLWINYKSENPDLIKKYGKLAFEWFVFNQVNLVKNDMSRVVNKYPQYFS